MKKENLSQHYSKQGNSEGLIKIDLQASISEVYKSKENILLMIESLLI